MIVSGAAQTSSPLTSGSYPESSEGLQTLLHDILKAAKSKDTGTEMRLIRTLILPADSAWFKDEFGPAYGPRLTAAYRTVAPTLEQEIRTVFEGNVQRGWMEPRIRRYEDAASVNSPIDHFLNCMDEVTPLYQSASVAGATLFVTGPDPGRPGKSRIVAGDLDGYYVYTQGGFRYIPQDVLMLLPKGRPVRIQLDMNAMRSKITNRVAWTYPADAIKQHISGRVVVHVVWDTAGNVKEANAVEGPPILSDAVLQAVKQWKAEPTTVDGDPVEVETNVEAVFEQH